MAAVVGHRSHRLGRGVGGLGLGAVQTNGPQPPFNREGLAPHTAPSPVDLNWAPIRGEQPYAVATMASLSHGHGPTA